ncbi:dynein regulation protein LC7 [Virgisporangium aliadipatigenens]|uniref:Dynein regulation protein LC7 n=1 Tax=Virgisporangium aliadipatigenens TaxID=741659 RepID=A0A8J3YI60_9ACTN|nr:roadblock/LC7 domain-containing protein [Virgisporangium aliadipatigenens]GIJ44752.1 dynein regulation protein LC7 [Virgisporangium aliadipatigenens]
MANPETPDLNWLVTAFCDRVAGVSHAVIVSPDGWLIAASEHLPQERADELAAITSGLAGITTGAAQVLECAGMRQTVVEMARGYFLVKTLKDGSVLAVLAARDADVGVVGYEMARLARRSGESLTGDSPTGELQDSAI